MLFDKRIKVLCFSSEATLKGLKWAFEQKVFTNRTFELYAGSLAKTPESAADFGLYLMTLDLGQPVPLENLKKLPKRPGVCGFLQPTPQQLLHLAELPDWNAVAWDGAAFDKLATRLDVLAERFSASAKIEQFMENSKLWLGHGLDVPSTLEWGNPPKKWTGIKVFPFNQDTRTLSLGGLKSKADIRVPLKKESDEICEFRYHDGIWSLELFGKSDGVSFAGNMDSVRPGDHLQIEDIVLQVRASKDVESFLGIVRKSGLFPGIEAARAPDSSKTLADVCREFLSTWTTGELRITSGLKNGSVFFVDGTIHHCVSGAVSGVKALTRMLGWDNPSWRYTPDRESDLHFMSMDMDFADFAELYIRWKDTWAKLRSFLPPSHLRLRASAKIFNAKKWWSAADYSVISAVCEYRLVRDIFNNCPLSDVDILASLVEMRRQGLVELQPPPPPKA